MWSGMLLFSVIMAIRLVIKSYVLLGPLALLRRPQPPHLSWLSLLLLLLLTKPTLSP